VESEFIKNTHTGKVLKLEGHPAGPRAGKMKDTDPPGQQGQRKRRQTEEKTMVTRYKKFQHEADQGLKAHRKRHQSEN